MDVRHRLGGYAEAEAPDGLADFVELLWRFEAPSALVGLSHRVLPTTGSSICFEYRRVAGRIEAPRVVVVGPVRAPRLFVPRPGVVLESVRLRAEWCRPLLGIDLRDWEGIVEELPRASGGGTALLDRAVASVRESGTSFPALLAHLTDRVSHADSDRASLVSTRGLDFLLGRDGRRMTSLRSAAEEVGVSTRHLRRAVVATTGASPKYLQRVRRLVGLMEEADGASRPRWSSLAVAHGFYDQAHLVNECRALVGHTPTGIHQERRAEQVRFLQYATASEL